MGRFQPDYGEDCSGSSGAQVVAVSDRLQYGGSVDPVAVTGSVRV